MKLHLDLDITTESAGILTHRLRDAPAQNDTVAFNGPVEVDETYMGDRRRNMSNARREALASMGRGAVGKTVVVYANDWETNRDSAKVVLCTNRESLQSFVKNRAAEGATVYMDDASTFQALPFNRKTFKHSLSEYVKGEVYANGIESRWSALMLAHKGTLHERLDRYVQELAWRPKTREKDTINHVAAIRSHMQEKRLPHRQLIADNGLASGTRA